MHALDGLLVALAVVVGVVIADGAAEAAATVEKLLSSPRSDGRTLRLIERHDTGPETSNQWLLRYACVEQAASA